MLSHLGYVCALARREWLRLGPQVELDELVASGTLGLTDAAQRFDPARGLSFLTFAHHRIRGAMLDLLRAQGRGPRRKAAEGERAPSPKRCGAELDELPGTFVDAEVALLRAERHRRLLDALANLPDRERCILERCYFDDQTLAEVGSSLGLSRSWACRLHARAVDQLRTAVEAA